MPSNAPTSSQSSMFLKTTFMDYRKFLPQFKRRLESWGYRLYTLTTKGLFGYTGWTSACNTHDGKRIWIAGSLPCSRRRQRLHTGQHRQQWRPCLHLDDANKKLQQIGLAVRNPERFGKLQWPYGRQCQLPATSIFIWHSSTPRCKNEAVPESSFLCMCVKARDYQPKCIIIISLQDQLLSVVTRWSGSILTNVLW